MDRISLCEDIVNFLASTNSVFLNGCVSTVVIENEIGTVYRLRALTISPRMVWLLSLLNASLSNSTDWYCGLVSETIL